ETETSPDTDNTSDTDSLHPDSDTMTDSESDSSEDSDTVTDSDTFPDSDSETDSWFDTETETATDTYLDTDTSTDTNSEIIIDTDSATDTDSQSDTDTGTGADTDTASDDIDTGEDTETEQIVVDTDTSPAYVATPVKEVRNHEGTITIDGFFSDWPSWDGEQFDTTFTRIVVDQHTGGAAPPEASFDVMWCDAGLYLGIAVKDSTLMTPPGTDLEMGDSIEFYIDAPPIDEGVFGPEDNWLIVPLNGNDLDSRTNLFGEDYQGHVPGGSSPGYYTEIYIPFDNFGIEEPPPPGLVLGLDVGVNDHDDASARDYKLLWYGDENNFYTPENYAKMILSNKTSTENYEEPPYNSCAVPRFVEPDSVEQISWSVYEQNTDVGDCVGGDRDAWFQFTLPAFSTIQVSAVNTEEISIWYKQLENTDCSGYTCQIQQAENDRLILTNLGADTEILLIVSASETTANTLSYITFAIQ
ncbi:MAG: hypothetical protein JXX29_14120, partial [Deltaproteobacteria bacterium]|nr:hypothetical protein [Deltaproteobacteria bacterium]